MILWGVGEHSRKVLERYIIPLRIIEFVVDSDKSMHGKMFMGKTILSPDKIKDSKSELVVIGTDKFYEEVCEQVKRINKKMKCILIDDFVSNYPIRGELTTVDEKRNDAIRLIKRVGSIPEKCFNNTKILIDRNEAVRRLKQCHGGMVAEVGVAYGDFSDFLLQEMQPKHFYAIDYFNKDNPYISFWGRTDFEDTGLSHEEWYKNRFREKIDSGRMTVCQGMSWECLNKFEDDFFDYIYIDACHNYEPTKKDIEASYKKIKNGGIIQFNDYTLYDIEGNDYYGVVPAVNEFLIQTKSEVLFYCLNILNYCDVVVRVNKEMS